MFLLLFFIDNHTTNLKITSRIILLNVTGLIRSLTITCNVALIEASSITPCRERQISFIFCCAQNHRKTTFYSHTLEFILQLDTDKGSLDYTHAWIKFLSWSHNPCNCNLAFYFHILQFIHRQTFQAKASRYDAMMAPLFYRSNNAKITCKTFKLY